MIIKLCHLFLFSMILFQSVCLGQAVAPQSDLSLLLLKSGNIEVASGSVEGIQVWIDTVESSAEKGQAIRGKGVVLHDDGALIERVTTYTLSDGMEMSHTMKAEIQGSDIIFNAKWETESAISGYSRINVTIPTEVAEDLTIESDGNTVFMDFDKSTKIRDPQELVFRRTSTGEDLFKLTGDFIDVTTFFLPEKPEQGLTLRTSNYEDLRVSTMNTVSTQNIKLSFFGGK